jgi:hypothetical protein
MLPLQADELSTLQAMVQGCDRRERWTRPRHDSSDSGGSGSGAGNGSGCSAVVAANPVAGNSGGVGVGGDNIRCRRRSEGSAAVATYCGSSTPKRRVLPDAPSDQHVLVSQHQMARSPSSNSSLSSCSTATPGDALSRGHSPINAGSLASFVGLAGLAGVRKRGSSGGSGGSNGSDGAGSSSGYGGSDATGGFATSVGGSTNTTADNPAEQGIVPNGHAGTGMMDVLPGYYTRPVNPPAQHMSSIPFSSFQIAP